MKNNFGLVLGSFKQPKAKGEHFSTFINGSLLTSLQGFEILYEMREFC